jgi:hypothetical protein
VSRWRDLSGNGRDALPTRPANVPKLVPAAVGGATRIVTPLPAGLYGNTNYTGAIGTDFVVGESVEITQLGVFDSGNNGIAGTLTVRLHRVDDNGTPNVPGDDSSAELLTTQVFTSAVPGTLEGSLRFLPLASPVSLVPGRYLIESSGWTGADSYMGYDSYEETRDGGISYLDQSRYNPTPGSCFGGTLINDNRYLAASSFKFRKPGATAVARDAVRFDGVDDGLLGPADYLLGRPSTIFMVFNQLTGTDGRLLQSGDGRNFLLGPHIGTDGLYCDGWVTQHTILRNQHSHVVGVYEGNQTRYFYNGQELTQVPGYIGVMGRLALGGAEGTYFQPCNADLAELIIYERAERGRTPAGDLRAGGQIRPAAGTDPPSGGIAGRRLLCDRPDLGVQPSHSRGGDPLHHRRQRAHGGLGACHRPLGGGRERHLQGQGVQSGLPAQRGPGKCVCD